MKSASFTWHGIQVVVSWTRNCFVPRTCKHLLHFTPSNDLVRGEPDALFQWCTLLRDCYMGHLNVRGDSGDAPLHSPG